MSSDDNEVYIGKALVVGNNQFKNAAAAKLGGIFCSTATTATVAVYNGKDATGENIVPAFVPTAGINYPLPINCPQGLFIVVTGTFTGTAMFT